MHTGDSPEGAIQVSSEDNWTQFIACLPRNNLVYRR